MHTKILIVDDYEANILALKNILCDLDLIIDQATSGEEALKLLLQNDYAIVLMDVHMPGMDGFETVSLMKKREKTKHTPVMFVSAVNTDEQSTLQGYDTGAVDYLYKPLNPEITLNKVRVFLELYNQKKEIEVLNSDLTMINEDLQDFTRIASHDLQEPLRTIGYYSSYLKHLLGDKAPTEQLEAAEIIIKSANNMSQLIRDLLSYSRCNWDFEESEVDLNLCLLEALKNLDRQINERKAKITYNTLPMVRGSQPMITQLFQNLISNAIKFQKTDSTPVICITHEVQNGEDVFGVKDQGIGFDTTQTDIIFQAFKRLKHEVIYPGNGIGLSTCQKIIQKHGGNLWVDAALDAGAHFQFTLGNSAHSKKAG